MTDYKLSLKPTGKWTYATTCSGPDKLSGTVQLTYKEGELLKKGYTYKISDNSGTDFGLWACERTWDDKKEGDFTPAKLAAETSGELAAETTYSVDFENRTPDTWTMSIYQTLPTSPGLKSLSWKQTTVPKNGESGVEWSISYLVGIANYKQIGGKGVYKASQKLGTQLGQKWACRFQDGAQQLFEDGSANPGQVLIQNKSGDLANLGIGMDGDLALVQSNVYSGNSAQFEVAPVYWVALYKDVVQGEVISGNQVHGPLQVVFPGGVTHLTYEAYIDGNEFVFGLKGGPAVRAPLDQVEMRLRMLQAA
ncbi:hypothetical protein BRAS3843_40005 [Bradyrhizobium sp. STM 3843]|uniref:hypothetical protein n=1 Tax=Bradyrhizobium sp. STM 3843 TaxID=551947 RepID=UPI000240344E|nr:hypothetical protein [Bradyrhizobium sp. STM 3843]CCE10147.1 hypothetical protein BRAS3843_40005 [Bradyrhizobium sp. STM 3843]